MRGANPPAADACGRRQSGRCARLAPAPSRDLGQAVFRGESRRGHLRRSAAAPPCSLRSVSARGGGWRRMPGDLRPAPGRSVLPPGTPLRSRTSPRPASAIRRPVASAFATLASPSPLPSVRKWGEVSNSPLRDMASAGHDEVRACNPQRNPNPETRIPHQLRQSAKPMSFAAHWRLPVR